jgi:hypothetical protein
VLLHADNIVWQELHFETLFTPLLVKYFGPKCDQTLDTRACFTSILPSSSASTVMGAPDSETPSPNEALDFDRLVNDSGTATEADSYRSLVHMWYVATYVNYAFSVNR